METHPYSDLNGFKNQLNLTDDEIKNYGFKPGGIWFNNTESIICGTFPPKKEYFDRKGYIHYSSNKNKLWKHIDAIFNTNLFSNSEDDKSRILNAKEKIKFVTEKKLGFVDIYSKIERKFENSSSDCDLIPVENIFNNGVFEEIIKSDVKQFIFVYSLSRDEFENHLKEKFPDIQFDKIREYKNDDITLEVKEVKFNKRTLYLTYSPIHGNISDKIRRPALKKAIEFDFK